MFEEGLSYLHHNDSLSHEKGCIISWLFSIARAPRFFFHLGLEYKDTLGEGEGGAKTCLSVWREKVLLGEGGETECNPFLSEEGREEKR